VILTTWNMQSGNADKPEVKWQTGVANLSSDAFVSPGAICLQQAGGVLAAQG
jgi:hypothetical protein